MAAALPAHKKWSDANERSREEVLIDLFAYFAATVPLTHVLTARGAAPFWVMAGPGALLVWANYKPAKVKAAAPVDWFKVAKVVSALIAVGVVNCAQLGYPVSPSLVGLVLSLNMAEAVLADAMLGGNVNALAGLGLVLLLIHSLAGSATTAWESTSEHGAGSTVGVFRFPLSTGWVAMYTSWNGAFVHGAGFAWNFRLVLLVPLVVAHVTMSDPAAWLGARTYSLLLAQALRGARAGRLFTPGHSFVTKAEGEGVPDPGLRVAWGTANLVGVACLAVWGAPATSSFV